MQQHHRSHALFSQPQHPPTSSANFTFQPGCNGGCATSNRSYLNDRLPILQRPGQHKEWDGYLERVYGGPLPASAYPLNLRIFRWFYHEELPLAGVAVAQINFHCTMQSSAFGHAWLGPAQCQSSAAGSATAWPESHRPLRRAGFFFNPLPWTARKSGGELLNQTWIEVMRVGVYNATEERHGVWYWPARGSGVWWNTGRSIRTWQGDLLGGEAEAERIAALRRRGVDSVQFVHSGTGAYRALFVELFDIRPTSGGLEMASAGPCAGAELRGGWEGRQQCLCHRSARFIRCRDGRNANRTHPSSFMGQV